MTDTNLTAAVQQRIANWAAEEITRLNAQVQRLSEDKRKLTQENRTFLRQLKEGRTRDAQGRDLAEDRLYRATEYIHELERQIALLQIEMDRRPLESVR